MTEPLVIVAAIVAGLIVLIGVVRASLWLGERKRQAGSESWVDSAHAGGDGWPAHGGGDGGGSD